MKCRLVKIHDVTGMHHQYAADGREKPMTNSFLGKANSSIATYMCNAKLKLTRASPSFQSSCLSHRIHGKPTVFSNNVSNCPCLFTERQGVS